MAAPKGTRPPGGTRKGSPNAGGSLFFSSQVGVPGVSFFVRSGACNLDPDNGPLGGACFTMPDDGSGLTELLLAPGQTATYEMIINESWKVSEVPEPSSFLLL